MTGTGAGRSYLAVECAVAVATHHRLGAVADEQRALRVPMRVRQKREVLAAERGTRPLSSVGTGQLHEANQWPVTVTSRARDMHSQTRKHTYARIANHFQLLHQGIEQSPVNVIYLMDGFVKHNTSKTFVNLEQANR